MSLEFGNGERSVPFPVRVTRAYLNATSYRRLRQPTDGRLRETQLSRSAPTVALPLRLVESRWLSGQCPLPVILRAGWKAQPSSLREARFLGRPPAAKANPFRKAGGGAAAHQQARA